MNKKVLNGLKIRNQEKAIAREAEGLLQQAMNTDHIWAQRFKRAWAAQDMATVDRLLEQKNIIPKDPTIQ